MRVFIRSKQTGYFFRTPDRWVSTRNEAYDFQECERVVYAVTELELDNIEMVMTDDSGKSMCSIDLSRNEKRASLRNLLQTMSNKSN